MCRLYIKILALALLKFVKALIPTYVEANVRHAIAQEQIAERCIIMQL